MTEPALSRESFQHTNCANPSRVERLPSDETQPVVAMMRERLQVLSPLISERMDHVLWRTFPPDEILAADQRPEYARGRAWLAFFIRFHPHCMIDGAPPDWTNLGRFMRHDRSTIKRGVTMLLARMGDRRFSNEVYQLRYISIALELQHGWGVFELGRFQAVEAKR